MSSMDTRSDPGAHAREEQPPDAAGGREGRATAGPSSPHRNYFFAADFFAAGFFAAAGLAAAGFFAAAFFLSATI